MREKRRNISQTTPLIITDNIERRREKEVRAPTSTFIAQKKKTFVAPSWRGGEKGNCG